MTAFPYLFHVDTRPAEMRAPFIHLTCAEEKWFDVFVADFEAQWDDARDWPRTSDEITPGRPA